ncbi:hypothetical protein Lal_00010817 [Lupinus albus]|nr:hypothetical protein Lal_00010817 [Lupinus albus]
MNVMVIYLMNDDVVVHPIPRQTGLRHIYTRVVKKDIRREQEPITMEVDRLAVLYHAKREARARRSGRTIKEISDSEECDKVGEDLMIPNVVWYSTDAMVLVSEHPITPSIEEHRAKEELVPYPLVIIIDSDAEVEEDPEEDPDEPKSTYSGVP